MKPAYEETVEREPENQEIPAYTLHYNNQDEEKALLIEEITSEATDLGRQWFGEIDLTAPLEIFILGEEDTARYPELFGGGFLDNKNRILIKSSLEENAFLNIYVHEFAHYLINEYSKSIDMSTSDLPDWFHEGVASSFAHRISANPLLLRNLNYEVSTFMDMKFNFKTDDIESEYLLSQYGIEYLIHHHDDGVISTIIDRTHELGSFSKSFEEVTNLKLADYHNQFEEDWDLIFETEELVNSGAVDEAEKTILLFLEEKGDYFNGASSLFQMLADIYIQQERYEEALSIQEKRLIYENNPQVFRTLAEIAIHEDIDIAVTYAEKAVEVAELENWNVQVFENWLEGIREAQ